MIRRALRVLLVGPIVAVVLAFLIAVVFMFFAVEWLMSWDTRRGNALDNATTMSDIIAASGRLVWYGTTKERW